VLQGRARPQRFAGPVRPWSRRLLAADRRPWRVRTLDEPAAPRWPALLVSTAFHKYADAKTSARARSRIRHRNYGMLHLGSQGHRGARPHDAQAPQAGPTSLRVETGVVLSQKCGFSRPVEQPGGDLRDRPPLLPASRGAGRGGLPPRSERLSLDRARGEPGDVVVEEEYVGEDDGHRPDERARHQRSPVKDVAAH
jgi:hypothetical protein